MIYGGKGGKMTAFRMPDGRTMRQYCLDEGVSYVIAYNRCDVKGMNPEDAVREARNPHPKNQKHFVNGTPLSAFCKSNGLRYDYVLKFHKRNKEKMNMEQCALYLVGRG